jgi:signal peptidase I
MRQFLASLLEIVEVALVAIGAVIVIRTFLVQPFLVSGTSMEPNFSNGDYLLIDEITYRFRNPERGEVSVFHYPNDESTYFIKRIIGLPGERVEIKNGKVWIRDGEDRESVLIAEDYLPKGLETGSGGEFTLGPDQYFVMGDNRSYSFDSRSWGALSSKEIVGVVRLRLWPVSGVKFFFPPAYGNS